MRSRPELHAFVEADPILQGDAVWEEQAWLKIGCMAEAGFLYDPVTETSRGESGGEDDGLTASEAAAFEVAMYGPEDGRGLRLADGRLRWSRRARDRSGRRELNVLPAGNRFRTLRTLHQQAVRRTERPVAEGSTQ